MNNIKEKLEKYEKLIKIGGIYEHYKSKNRSMCYKVLSLSILEEDMDILVNYQPLYGDMLQFSRRASIWLEQVIVNGGVVNRFTLL